METGKNKYCAAVLTISTSCNMAEREDISGPLLEKLCREAGIEVLETGIVPDEKTLIQESLLCFCEDPRVDLILTTGGTGPGPLDITPEVTASICDRIIPGIGELIRAEGGKKTRRAYLSRGIAGIRKNTLIINLPGSPKGVAESMDAVSPIIIHAIKMIEGEGHDGQ